MRRLFRQRQDKDGLEAQLRARRARPREGFTETLAERVRSSGRRRAQSPFRIALAGTLTALALVALAIGGGWNQIGSATAAVKAQIQKASSSTPQAKRRADKKSPGDDQYKPGKGCGDKNHIHEREFQCKGSAGSSSATEGQPGRGATMTFAITLSAAPYSVVTASYKTVDGTARRGSDYVPASGKLTWAIGQTSQTVTVPIVGDSIREASETVNLTISGVSDNAVIAGPGVGTIIDDD